MLLHVADAATRVVAMAAARVVAMAAAMAAARVVAMAAARTAVVAILVVADAIPVAEAEWVACEKSCLDFAACFHDADVAKVAAQAADAIPDAIADAIADVIPDAVAIPVVKVAVTPVAGQDARIILAS